MAMTSTRRMGTSASIKGAAMTDGHRLAYLRALLIILGIVCVALYPLMTFWPSGWAWHAGYSDYAMMIVGIYATLGVFLIIAARNPMEHLSLIWFTAWSSLVHGAIMAVQSVIHVEHIGHLWGDVPALFIAAIMLAVLTPRRGIAASRSAL
jgi:membrane associated rhomboid family serine protease